MQNRKNYEIDWNQDAELEDDLDNPIRNFRVFDPIVEEIEIREFLRRGTVIED